MHETDWIILAVAVTVIFGGWLAWDWHTKHPPGWRTDEFADADQRRPVYDWRSEGDFPTDARLPSAAERTAQLAALGEETAHDLYMIPGGRNYVHGPAYVAKSATAPRTISHPAVHTDQPASEQEWQYRLGRWWPPAAVVDSLPSSAEPDWLRTLLMPAVSA